MITGHKPSGYFVTGDKNGRKIEGETRQCVHCQFTWEYVPNSGERRGYCTNCNGFDCARAECIAEQKRLTAGTRRSCIPFEEWGMGDGLKVTETGLFIKKHQPQGIFIP